jgi:DNA-directed RNA polymerase specialized sigma24 family protein
LLRQAGREPLAGRFVLEALFPGLKNLSRRVLAQQSDREEVWCLLLACAWERIATYPLERRPTRVAANVLLDTLHDSLAYLRAEARQRRDLVPHPSPTPSAAGTGDPDVERLLGTAIGDGAITASEAELILATRIDGRSLATEAEAAGVAYNTMKVRRQRAERRLLVFLGYPPVPRGAQRRPFSSHARRGEARHAPCS